MKKYFLIVFTLISSAFLFLQIPFFFNQEIQAAVTTTNVPCTCDHLGQIDVHNGAKLNGYTCGSYHNFCPNETMACVNKTGHIIYTATNAGRAGGTITNYTGVDCALGTASNGKIAIDCTCTTPNSSGQNTTIKCTNNLTGEVQSKACGTDKVCAIGPALVHVSFGENVYGADCQETCKCNGTNGQPGTHGQAGQDKNLWTCADTSKNSHCPNLEDYCQNDPSKPGGTECISTIKCSCSGTVLKCTTGVQGEQPYSTDCASDGKLCVQKAGIQHEAFGQAIKGIDCLPPVQPTLPPPPSPPCKQWDPNGRCDVFNSTFGGFATDPEEFIQKVFAVLLSVSGGIALLLIMRAGYNLMTAQGNPEKLNNAREQLVAAIVGLIFLIFSFVFLELIGYDILRLPKFDSTSATSPGGGTCPVGSCIQTSICTVKNPGHCNSNGCPSGQSCIQ